MPNAPKRPCAHPGCPALVDRGRCEQHSRQERKAVDERRGSAASRGYDSRWRKYRAAYLIEHPLCVICSKLGHVGAATVVDHIKSHKGDMVLFWDQSNWQALCKACHDRKTATEDGRWG